MFVFKGSEKDQDQGSEKGLFGETAQINVLHFKEIWRNDSFQNSWHLIENYYQNRVFTENQKGPCGAYEYFWRWTSLQIVNNTI